MQTRGDGESERVAERVGMAVMSRSATLRSRRRTHSGRVLPNQAYLVVAVPAALGAHAELEAEIASKQQGGSRADDSTRQSSAPAGSFRVAHHPTPSRPPLLSSRRRGTVRWESSQHFPAAVVPMTFLPRRDPNGQHKKCMIRCCVSLRAVDDSIGSIHSTIGRRGPEPRRQGTDTPHREYCAHTQQSMYVSLREVSLVS